MQVYFLVLLIKVWKNVYNFQQPEKTSFLDGFWTDFEKFEK